MGEPFSAIDRQPAAQSPPPFRLLDDEYQATSRTPPTSTADRAHCVSRRVRTPVCMENTPPLGNRAAFSCETGALQLTVIGS